MNRLLPALTGAAILIVAGCTQGTPGGPGMTGEPPTTFTAQRPNLGLEDDTFNLGVPVLSTRIQQGTSQDASISLNRGKNFEEDVTLKFDDLPKGITVDPIAPVIRHGEKEAKVVFHAADDAALGDFTIKLTGHPTKGTDAQSEFLLSVTGK